MNQVLRTRQGLALPTSGWKVGVSTPGVTLDITTDHPGAGGFGLRLQRPEGVEKSVPSVFLPV